MAEPARNLYDEDKPDDKYDPSPRFEVHQGGGETSTPKKGHLKSVDGDDTHDKSSNAEKDLYKEGDDKLSASKAEELEARKLGVKSEDKGSLYNATVSAPTSFLKKNKKTSAALATAAALAIGVSIFFFVILAPLKILHIVNNLQDRFFATAENAIDKEMDQLFSNYIKGKIRYWKAGSCRDNGWIDHACNPYRARDGIFKKLYYGWSDARLEDSLRRDHGISFSRRDNDRNIYMEISIPGGRENVLLSGDDFIGPDSNNTIGDMIDGHARGSPVTRNEIKRALKKALENETWYKRTMYRIKVGKFLERKHGMKRCIIACTIRDGIDNWQTDKARAAKMFVAQRVLAPRAETFGYLYECVMDRSCDADHFRNYTADTYQADANGCQASCTDGAEPKSDFDRENRNMLIQRLVNVYDGDVDRLRADYDNVRQYGLFASFGRFPNRVEDDGESRTNSRLGGDLARQVAIRGGARALPIVGQIDMAATIIGATETLRVAAPAMVKIMNSTSAAQYFGVMRTAVDEIKQGDTDNEMVGSFVSSLGPGVQIDSTAEAQENFGGTAGAEQSPLYAVLMGNADERASFSLKNNIFSTSAVAQTASPTASPDYQCDNGSYPSNENPVCPDQKVRPEGNAVLDGFNRATTGNPFWSTLTSAANLWNNGSNFIMNTALRVAGALCPDNVLRYLSPFCILLSALQEAADEILGGIASYINDRLRDGIVFLFTNIFGLSMNIVNNDMSGAWSFNAVAAGADVAGNDYSHHGLGGRKLTAAEVTQIINEQESERYLAYQSQPLLERVLDTESKYSPVAKMALSVPASKKEVLAEGPLSYISSMFNSLLGSFGGLFGGSADAQTQRVMEDPFGIDQYGYPENDPTMEEDPETFWSTYCTTQNDGNSDPAVWSLTKLYNRYSAMTTTEANSYTPTNNTPSVSSLNDRYRNDPGAIAIVDAFRTKSPNGTNRCLLIQAALGSGGATFTDEVLTPEERGEGTPGTPSTPTQPPGGNLPPPTGADQSSTQCDSRTRSIGIYQGYQNGNPVQIRLCALPNLPSTGQESNGGYGVSGGNGQALVNAAVSRNFYELVEAANSALPANLQLSANSSFRTMSHQEELCRQDDKCPGGDYSDVARPGTSNHQMGLAIDFDIKGISESVDSCIRQGSLCTADGFQDWEWLNTNATRFGLRQYSNEFWHFSPTGS